MKIILPCLECIKEYGIPNLKIETQEYNDKGIYRHICDKGHESYTIDQAMKFERLFEIAGCAYLDGYYRESVASATSALERFYEFSIKVFIKKVLNEDNQQEYIDTWNNVSNQSERQLGAYYFLYLSNYKKAPPTIKNGKVKFRNEVIHKGKIPTKDEAYDYIECIYDYIYNRILEIKKDFTSEILNVIFYEMTVANKTLESIKNLKINSLSDNTLLSLNRVGEKESLKEKLLSLEKKREIVINPLTKNYKKM